MKLSDIFNYVDTGVGIEMTGEMDVAPYEAYVIGRFHKQEEGYWVFTPQGDRYMTCRILREAAKKCSILNGSGQ